MEFSEIFSFLSVLKESMTLLPKIWKITTPIAVICLVLSSSVFLLFSYSFQIIMDTAIRTTDSIYKDIFILLAAEIVFLAVFIASSHLSGIATIIASAMAYTDKRLSPSDLLCKVRQTWRKPFKASFRLSRKSSLGVLLLGVCIAVLTVNDIINVVTITLLIVASILFILYQLKASVSIVLAYMALVVEDINDGTEAVERGEHLAEGQRLKGFMMNLFINILVCGCFLVFWFIVGDKGPLNFTIYGLSFVVFVGVMRISTSVLVTVFYFQCRKHHGEEIDVVGDTVLYAKIPASSA